MTFFCKLLAPRADFAQTMTDAERLLMQEHAVYWHQGIKQGRVIGFGLVADPRGAFGVGIVEFDDEAGACAFADGDPTIRSGQGFAMEIAPMPMGFVRG
ncbi:MAG TPA: YciI family protein [Longimicrobium sp.]|nr:YciI family protein [Longimicrobium sp.]